MGDVKLPFGLHGDEYVHISRVERGLACGCICPGCKKELVAKKGEIAVHHFAHKAEFGCNYQPETSLHDYAKRLGDVVDWCRERYGVFSFGPENPESPHDPSSPWSMTPQEESVYDFLRELEIEKYLKSDGFIAKGRQFIPTGKPLGKR